MIESKQVTGKVVVLILLVLLCLIHTTTIPTNGLIILLKDSSPGGSGAIINTSLRFLQHDETESRTSSSSSMLRSEVGFWGASDNLSCARALNISFSNVLMKIKNQTYFCHEKVCCVLPHVMRLLVFSNCGSFFFS